LERQQKNFRQVGSREGNEWRTVFFLEGSAHALPKNSFLGTSGDVPSSFVNLWMVRVLLNRNQHDRSRELQVFVEVSCLGFNAKILADKVKKLRVVWHK
jgi:hypothetical protein